jgi:hypothetical protein
MEHTGKGTCRGCGAEMLWVEMIGTGKRNPLNPKPDPERGDILVVAGSGSRRLGLSVAKLTKEAREEAKESGAQLYLSHFATCPDRGKFKRGKKREEKAEASS